MVNIIRKWVAYELNFLSKLKLDIQIGVQWAHVTKLCSWSLHKELKQSKPYSTDLRILKASRVDDLPLHAWILYENYIFWHKFQQFK